jgi:hypothetical protein
MAQLLPTQERETNSAFKATAQYLLRWGKLQTGMAHTTDVYISPSVSLAD